MASRSSKQSIRARWFKNDKKEKPSHPDYRGDATTRGRKFWVSTWIKTSEKTGKRFMSLAFRGAGEPPAKPKPKAPTDTDADIHSDRMIVASQQDRVRAWSYFVLQPMVFQESSRSHFSQV